MSTPAAATPLLALAGGDWTASLLPGLGAAFTSLAWRGQDLLVPLPLGADPTASFGGAFVMAPWANRLDGGRLPVLGVEYRLPINRPQDNTAIHGLSRDQPWTVATAEPACVLLTLQVDTTGLGLPWRYDIRLEVTLADAATIALKITNLGDMPAPFGLGWHPFFRRSAGTRLRFRATTLFPRDARSLPVAAQPTAGVDGDETAYLGLDTHFAGWDGTAEIEQPGPEGGLRLRLVASGALAGNLQVFAPPADDVLCVEPVSHVPDAPNRPGLASHGALALLPPGNILQGAVVLAAGR